MSFWKAPDLARIFEAAFTLLLCETWIILPETLQAGVPDRRGVRFPVGGGQLAVAIAAH